MKRYEKKIFFKYLYIMAISCVFLCNAGLSVVSADPSNDRNYLSLINSRAVALDTDKNLLYVGIESGSNNLRTLLLDAQGDTTNTWGVHSIGGGTIALSLDAHRDRLYTANNVLGTSNEFTIVTLDSSDGTITSGTNYNLSNAEAQCLALDYQRNRVYVGLADSTTGLLVITLNASGDYFGSSLITTNREVHALAIDPVRNKLYCGYGSGNVGTCDLDGNGDVDVVNTPRVIGSNDVSTMALNTFDNTLYVAEVADNNLYTFSLEDNTSGDPGEIMASPNTFFLGTSIYCLTLDATRSRLYMGTHSGSSDLKWVDLDGSAIPTGSASSFAGSNLEAIALDAKRQKIYGVMTFNSLYYQLTDLSMPAFLIEHGATITNSVNVELHWSLPNAQYIRVESSSDLVSYNFPDLGTPNMIFDQWYSTGSERWSNDGSSRANTLTVNAVLSGGNGDKTIRIWFAEDAGAGNGCSVNHYETAIISLNGSGTSTFTPTVSPTPTMSPTGTATPTFTSTNTVTPSETPSRTMTYTLTPSHSPTLTVTPTMTPSHTPSWTPTFTSTPSNTPTHSPTSTISPTHTTTMTGTPTNTSTYTATPSSTPSITPSNTASPTGTMTLTVSPTPTYTPIATATVTPTCTPTESSTGTVTITPTRTNTITISPTSSYTLTSTPTPLVTATPTATITLTPTDTQTVTPSPTISMTPSVTRTNTCSPTITETVTITTTIPPTKTPTPADVFYLDKNRFFPNKEILNIKIGMLDSDLRNISIYTLNGKCVLQKQVSVTTAGYSYIQWDGRNQNGEAVAAGVYFIVLEKNGKRSIRKILVLR